MEIVEHDDGMSTSRMSVVVTEDIFEDGARARS